MERMFSQWVLLLKISRSHADGIDRGNPRNAGSWDACRNPWLYATQDKAALRGGFRFRLSKIRYPWGSTALWYTFLPSPVPVQVQILKKRYHFPFRQGRSRNDRIAMQNQSSRKLHRFPRGFRTCQHIFFTLIMRLCKALFSIEKESHMNTSSCQ